MTHSSSSNQNDPTREWFAQELNVTDADRRFFSAAAPPHDHQSFPAAPSNMDAHQAGKIPTTPSRTEPIPATTPAPSDPSHQDQSVVDHGVVHPTQVASTFDHVKPIEIIEVVPEPGEPARPKDLSSKSFRLDQADWMPAPHSTLLHGKDLTQPVASEPPATSAPPTVADDPRPETAENESSSTPTQLEQTEAPAASESSDSEELDSLPEIVIVEPPKQKQFVVKTELTFANPSIVWNSGAAERKALPANESESNDLSAHQLQADNDLPLDKKKTETPATPETSSTDVASLDPMMTETLPTEDLPSIPAEINSGPAIVTTDASTAMPTSEPVKAAWEVDAFRWPTVTSELLQSQRPVFNTLYDSLLQLPGNRKVVGMTGVRSGDGRSTLAICLARWAAEQQLNTLLVDGDLLRGSLVHLSGLDFDFGWQQGLLKTDPVEEYMVRSEAQPLSILCLRPEQIPETSYREAALRLDQYINDLRDSFDLIVVDSGPADEISKFRGPNRPAIDLGVIVRNLNGVSVEDLQQAQRHLSSVGISNLAIAENFGQRMAG